MAYRGALEAQYQAHARVASGASCGELLLVEHHPVITLGRNGDLAHLLWNTARLEEQGIPVVATDRGGEVTAHMPGQLVVYPILPLAAMGLGARAYVTALESSVIETLSLYHLRGEIQSGRPGVWLGAAKVCALGIRIWQRISLHGIALNVVNDLSLFDAMVPCGIHGAGVTRLCDHLKRPPPMAEVSRHLLRSLEKNLRLSAVEPAPNGHLPILG